MYSAPSNWLAHIFLRKSFGYQCQCQIRIHYLQIDQCVNFQVILTKLWFWDHFCPNFDFMVCKCLIWILEVKCNLVFIITDWFLLAGIWKGEGGESLRFMFAFYCIFFWKRSPLIFHRKYQSGGKILSIVKPPVARRSLRN